MGTSITCSHHLRRRASSKKLEQSQAASRPICCTGAPLEPLPCGARHVTRSVTCSMVCLWTRSCGGRRHHATLAWQSLLPVLCVVQAEEHRLGRRSRPELGRKLHLELLLPGSWPSSVPLGRSGAERRGQEHLQRSSCSSWRQCMSAVVDCYLRRRCSSPFHR